MASRGLLLGFRFGSVLERHRDRFCGQRGRHSLSGRHSPSHGERSGHCWPVSDRLDAVHRGSPCNGGRMLHCHRAEAGDNVRDRGRHRQRPSSRHDLLRPCRCGIGQLGERARSSLRACCCAHGQIAAGDETRKDEGDENGGRVRISTPEVAVPISVEPSPHSRPPDRQSGSSLFGAQAWGSANTSGRGDPRRPERPDTDTGPNLIGGEVLRAVAHVMSRGCPTPSHDPRPRVIQRRLAHRR
jgi:hypothetical protein